MSRHRTVSLFCCLLFTVLQCADACSGVRVDEPGPPRSPRLPLPADYQRKSNVQVTAGSGAFYALGLTGSGWIAEATFERVRSPHSSWTVRASSGRFEDLFPTGIRTLELRDGELLRARNARCDGIELGARATSHGKAAFTCEADAGVSRTRIDGLAVYSRTGIAVPESRHQFQACAGLILGHVWQPAHIPVGFLAELGGRARFGSLSGGELSARIGLLGQSSSSSEGASH